MTAVPDTHLFANAERARGKVVLITGAASGIGKTVALCFAKYGAKIVIGDMDLKGAEEVVLEIRSLGSDGVAQKCDVRSWDQQLALFKTAKDVYGRIDIVIPNAGVSERGHFAENVSNGVPAKPDIITLEVNLIGVLYTTRLALFYLLETYLGGPDNLKAIVFVGSMSSIQSIGPMALYSTSKHALLGLMKSLYLEYKDRIRFGIVCPWIADTPIMSTTNRLFMAGMPLTPLSRIGGAIFKAATDADPDSNGAVYTLPDDGETFRLDHSQLRLNEGFYKLLNDRTESLYRLKAKASVTADVVKILGPKLLPLAIIVIVGILAWKQAPVIRSYADF